MAELDKVRANAKALLATVGVSRITVVDDEYAERVDILVGVCEELGSEAVRLPHLEGVSFDAPSEIWSDEVRDVWHNLSPEERQALLAAARRAVDLARGDVSEGSAAESQDNLAAACLTDILQPEICEFVTLSLGQWEERREEMLTDAVAARTLFLFDRDFGEERAGTDDEGFALIREVLTRGAGYCGLITHTVSVGEEYEAWRSLAETNGLARDRFVVVSKERLNGDPPDYYGFLAMLRLAALGGRYAELRSTAWSIFEQSLDHVKAEVEGLTVLDFDRMFFASSRREGVWEPDTLFRVIGVVMRHAASVRLHEDRAFFEEVAQARRVSASSEEIAVALGRQGEPAEALRIQRSEMYEPGKELNAWHTPIGLGDIFQIGPDQRSYILLGQPCDLMVRSKGFRSYENGMLGPMVAVVEVVAPGEQDETEGSTSGKLPFYDEGTGEMALARYARVHQVRLAVLDLCVFRDDGSATIELTADCPDDLIDAWRKRHGKLQRYFGNALKLHSKLVDAGLDAEVGSLALPDVSTTLKIGKTIGDGMVRYEVTRLMRLRPPWSAALLTEFAHHEARAAFEHDFGERIDATGEAAD